MIHSSFFAPKRLVSTKKQSVLDNFTKSSKDTENKEASTKDVSDNSAAITTPPESPGKRQTSASPKRSRSSSPAKFSAKSSRKRVIQDEEDEDEDAAITVAEIPSHSPTSGEKSESESETQSESPTIPPKKKSKTTSKSLTAQLDTTEIQKDALKSGLPKILHDGSLEYECISETFEKIDSVSSRLKIVEYAAELFLNVLRVKPEELSQTVYLCINRLGPDYEGLELGLGESLIMKALGEATGRTIPQIKAEYKNLGDLGSIALKSRKNQSTMMKPKPLSIQAVFNGLYNIATFSGKESQTRKITIIKKLLTASQGVQAKYLVRSLEGKLRIGLAEKSVLTALAQAFVAWEVEKESIESGKKRKPTPLEVSQTEEVIKDVYCKIPNYGKIIEAAIEGGIQNVVDTCKLTAGIPLKPMLAKPTKSITEILDRFNGEEFTCEYKYDGERAQVHLTEDGKIHVYSRNMEDMSQRYPDILSSISGFAKEEITTSYILDCEAVAWDRERRKLLPFQVLSTRKRKDVDESKITVFICLFAFDLLYLNGEPMLNKTLQERRQLLETHFTPKEGSFSFAKSINSDNVEDIQTFLDQSVKDSCEGLMIKVLNGKESGYEPSKRSRNWLKLKKDYIAGVGDSLDLVVLGAYHGKGKRTNFYGAFLLGCYNQESEQYETICKIGTGFSDEMLDTLYKALLKTVIEKPKEYYTYDSGSNTQPDVWFEPTMVWEVLTADLSLSPIYKAGIDNLGKGVSLRFPRFLRIREDKGVEDITSSDQIVEFYKRQASITSSGGGASDEE